MLLCVFLYLLDSCAIMMWLLLWKCCWCVFTIMSRDWLLEMKQILCRLKTMLLWRRNYVLCRNQSIGSGVFSRPINWMEFLSMEKWKMFRTNRLVLDDNWLYYLSVLKKRNFLQGQSIDSGLQSIAQTYWLWKLEIRSAVNRLTLNINRLILCILWKT